ncbi:MAG: 1-(5-phosphoribosyl)-5-amino-4-imidazole-carboxylate carboxylase [Planctomycetota bacterium]|nr:MAG: 1-(5-phosphoribosyl)-5-amino-4-imidazole-carboxylate carboxylase [Planctomycetota bacterium]
MHPSRLHELLAAVHRGELDPHTAADMFAAAQAPELQGVVRIDHDRPRRLGVPEAILCTGKRPEDVGAIAAAVVAGGGDLLATRADRACWEAVRARVPDARWEERARCIVRRREGAPPPFGLVAVVAAGTADVPVAEEARVTAELLGSRTAVAYDVGVAGLHRLLPHLQALRRAQAIVVAAGMDAALPSVVAGLVPGPVIAVPTSVGYGASFGGLAALLAVLNSCAPGVAVVNIDNGFGAGTLAHLINARAHRAGADEALPAGPG